MSLHPNSGVIASIEAAAEKIGAEVDERGVPKHLGRLQRKVQLSGYDAEKHTVTMAVSSSTPVERYFGAEILSHEKGAINTERLQGGIALLFNHDYDQHLGRSVGFEMGDPLHVTCSFAGNDLARSKEGDVASGHLVDVSIGYIVDEWDIVENAKTGQRTYTATKWTLLEVSLVTVPADPTVGVGRSSDPAPNVRSFRKVDDDGEEEDEDDDDADSDEGERSAEAAAAPVDPAPVPTSSAPEPSTTIPETQRTETMAAAAAGVDLAAQNQERVSALRTLHQQYPNEFSERSLKAAEDLGVAPDTIKERIANAIISASQRDNVSTIGDEVLDGISGRESRQFLLRDYYAAAINERSPKSYEDKGAGYAREVSEEIRAQAKARNIETGNGILVPSLSAQVRSLQQQQRTMASGGNFGQYTNFTDVASTLIELLRFRPALLALGATVMSGLKGQLQMPRQNAAASSNWVQEGGAGTSSDIGLDDIVMNPKRLTMMNSYYRETLLQSAISVEPALANDRSQVLKRSLDTAGFSGSGTNGVPLGLLNYTGLAEILAGSTRANNGTVTAGLGGVPMTQVDWDLMESTIDTANGDISTLRTLTTPKVRGGQRNVLQAPGTASGFVWPRSKVDATSGFGEGPNGYDALCTSAPYLTGFSANSVNGLHAAVMGCFDQILVGDWGFGELIVDNITGAANAKVTITEHAYYDINIRNLACFCACTSALPS